MPIFFWLLLLLFKSDMGNPAYADSGRDRCRTTDCLCLVNRGTVPTQRNRVVTTERRQLLYFDEDGDQLTDSQSNSLSDFVRQNTGTMTITLMGYTDGCGTSVYNRALAFRRIQEVRDIIRQAKPGIRINTVVGGEQVQHHSSQARRVDVIVHTTQSFTTRIERIPADVYLVDGSGSMWEGRRDWLELVNASFRPGSRIYMSMMHGCYNGQNIDNIRPQGGTEIWMSYYAVLEKMQPGETLLIISDFDSNVRLTSREAEILRRKVRERGVNVITVQ